MIQARSLAHVVDLADNPPLHYQQYTGPGRQEALAFYIARVPGSKDVFLTTIKPLDKVVRAEDVQSCLYYIHVHSEQDEELRQDEGTKLKENENDLAHECAEERSELPIIRRKPLPQQPHLALGDRPKPPPKMYPHYQPHLIAKNPNTQLERKAVGGDSGLADRGFDDGQANRMRKVMGPRPMHDRLHSEDNAALGSPAQRQNTDSRRWSEVPFLNANRFKYDLYGEKMRELDDIYSANCAPLNGLGSASGTPSLQTRGTAPAEPIAETRMSGVHFTLIRRYDGKQSNVCRIECPSVAGQRQATKIDVLAPEYAKFCDQNLRRSQDQSINSFDGSLESTKFQCLLQVKQGNRRPAQASRPQSYESSLPRRGMRRSLDIRRHNQYRSDNVLTSDMTGEITNSSAPTYSNQYTFETPWNGTCEFTSGIAGRSLKCKNTPSGGGPSGPPPSTLSELRFNLPSSQALRSPQKTSRPGTPREVKRSSFFSRHSPAISEERYGPDKSALVHEDHDEDRLDLSLGQEHAGGGFGGKQAKLGKLIIEADGLQMLDLLVAANMAMWWKVYDKFT